MINVRYRFHGHGSLRYLFKNGFAVRSKFFTIKYIKNPRRKEPRFAVVISKKVHKSAVGRNRMRRRIYEIIRLEQIKMASTRDMAVIVTNSEILSMNHEDLTNNLIDLFKRADIYS